MCFNPKNQLKTNKCNNEISNCENELSNFFECSKTNQCFFKKSENLHKKYQLLMTIFCILTILFFILSFICAYFLYKRQSNVQKNNYNNSANKQQIVSNLRLISTLNNQNSTNFLEKIWKKILKKKEQKFLTTNLQNSLCIESVSASTSSGFPSTIALAEIEQVIEKKNF